MQIDPGWIIDLDHVLDTYHINQVAGTGAKCEPDHSITVVLLDQGWSQQGLQEHFLARLAGASSTLHHGILRLDCGGTNVLLSLSVTLLSATRLSAVHFELENGTGKLVEWFAQDLAIGRHLALSCWNNVRCRQN